jgi:hypothetical protein
MRNVDFEQFRKDFDKAVKSLGEQYGVSFSIGNIKYDDLHFTTTMTAKKNQVNGISGEQAEFNKYCKFFGLTPEHYNVEIILGGKKFKLYGFNHRARKNPLLIRDENGKEYIAERDCIKNITNPNINLNKRDA